MIASVSRLMTFVCITTPAISLSTDDLFLLLRAREKLYLTGQDVVELEMNFCLRHCGSCPRSHRVSGAMVWRLPPHLWTRTIRRTTGRTLVGHFVVLLPQNALGIGLGTPQVLQVRRI